MPSPVDVLKEASSLSGAHLPSMTGLESQTMRAALAALADVLLVVDGSGSVVSVTFGAETDLSRDLALGVKRQWLDFLAPDSKAKGAELLASAGPGQTSRPREINHLGQRPGFSIPIRYRAIASRPNGDVLLIGTDLQPQAKLQEQLVDAQQSMERDYDRMRAVETRYRILFQLGGTPMMIVDTVSRKILEANSACAQAFGLALNRITGRTVASLFDEHDSAALQSLLASALTTGDGIASLMRAATGEQTFDLRAHLFRQESTSLLLVQAHPQSAQAPPIRHDGTSIPALIERLPEGFVITDAEGLIIEANRAFLDMAELPVLGSALGQCLDGWLGRTRIDFGVLLSSLQKHDTIRAFPSLLRGGYGSELSVEVSAVRMLDQGASRIGFLIRSERRTRAVDPRNMNSLPRSLDQMKDLVGNVPLKELVRETTDVIERLCIEAALELTADNRASAAELLGLSRQSLYAKLHRFGLGNLGQDEDM